MAHSHRMKPKHTYPLFIVFLVMFMGTISAHVPSFVVVSTIVNNSLVPYDYRRTVPAVDMALEVVNQSFGQHFHLEYLYRDGGPACKAKWVGSLASELHSQFNITAFIGPGCSFAVEVLGYMAAAWNLPIITPVGTKSSLSVKKDYTTLTRLSYDMSQFANFYVKLFEYFKWKHVAVIYDMDNIFSNIVGSSLVPDFEKRGNGDDLTVKDFPYQRTKNPDYTNILQKASVHARIFVMSSHGNTMREIMLLAGKLGMTNGEYCFIFIRLFDGDDVGDFSWRRNDTFDEDARQAYESVLTVTLMKPKSEKFYNFTQEVRRRALTDYRYDYGEAEVNNFIVGFYDAFLVYAQVLNETLAEGGDPYDGLGITKRLRNRKFEGMSGNIAIDAKGDRESDFSLLDMDRSTGLFQVLGNYIGSSGTFSIVSDETIHWPNDAGPPLDIPECGFTGDAPKCNPYNFPEYGIIAIAFSGLVILVAVVGLLVYRKMKLEADLESNWWRIKWEEINQRDKSIGRSFLSTSKTNTASSAASALDAIQVFAQVGFYKSTHRIIDTKHGEEIVMSQSGHKEMASGISQFRFRFTRQLHKKLLTDGPQVQGNCVAIKKLNLKSISLSRDLQMEFKQMRDLSHPNLVKFVGMCIDTPNISIMTEYCQKGSLQDILGNASIQLDWEFKLSLLNDIAQGMVYLHQSHLGVHGYLSSSNCVIDNRFVLKLTDYGILSLRGWRRDGGANSESRKLWVAPEHLRDTDNARALSQKGDIYSFGIILYEIITRQEPYEAELETLELSAILDKILAGKDVPFRPSFDQTSCTKDAYHLTLSCWDEDPIKRLPFVAIMRSLKAMHSGREGVNLLDTLLRRMENYANNLEQLVEERTFAFLEEKKKSEQLLYQVLPKSVADQLKNGKAVAPESYDCVTIYFSDICGFTNISAESSPMQVVDLLNDLYTCFDSTIDRFDVYKVETIGDAYMVVSGLPIRNDDKHAQEIARMSLAILETVKQFRIRHKPDQVLRARIGVHSGPVCSGVVGLKMPRYCLFGDTVNTASRMESHGEGLKIHTSDTTRLLLDNISGFDLEPRGEIEVKGKGTMKTYWLLGAPNSTIS